MDLQWIVSVRELFTQVYGPEKGRKVCDVVVPAVVADFRKTVLAAPAGRTITEQYRTDDRRTGLTVTGRLGEDGRVRITSIEVGGTQADLGKEPVII